MNKKKALLIDITACIGCNACQEACKKENGLPEGEEKHLSATAYTALDEYNGVYVRRMCQHCQEPTCLSVCPVGAFTKTAEGPVLYDESKCIGCRYCMQACPFQVPRYQWDSTYPRVEKCRLCYQRIRKGLPTACAEACPAGATIFGNFKDLLKEAYQRIKAEPEKYVDRVYGIEEIGGTSILYLTNVPFEKLGFKTNLPKNPLPALTWNALSKVPSIVSVGGVLLYGIWWITNRRMEVEKYEKKLKEMQENRSNHDDLNQ